jgi:hypothetical protein
MQGKKFFFIGVDSSFDAQSVCLASFIGDVQHTLKFKGYNVVICMIKRFETTNNVCYL